MDDQPKRKGRPSGKRGTFSFRVTPALRAQLEAAATAAERPVSEVIETRLEASFRDDDAMRVIRETVRQEMRAEFTARQEPPAWWQEQMDQICGPAAYHRINGGQ